MAVPPLDQGARSALRRSLRARRRAAERSGIAFAGHIDSRVATAIASAAMVGLYLPMPGEPDPAMLIDADGVMTSLPALTDDDSMVFRRWTRGDALVAAPWGGRQPDSGAATVRPDVIFVPLLGFDRALNRIGQGGGHYDRYLAAHPRARRIGVAWEAQRLDRIDPESWDVPLDAVVTEQRSYVEDLDR